MTVQELIKALIREKDYKTEIVVSFDGNLFKLSSNVMAETVRQTFKYCFYDYVKAGSAQDGISKRVLILSKEHKQNGR